MRRDIDLLRAILIQIESEGDPAEPLIHSMAVEGYEQAVVNEHVKLLIDSGFVEGEYKYSTNNRILLTLIRGLTPKAYEFLDNIRNEQLWERIKERVTTTTGTASLGIIENFAHQVISAALLRSSSPK